MRFAKFLNYYQVVFVRSSRFIMSFFFTIDLDKQASLLQAAILAGKLLEKGTRYRKALKLVCQEVYCYNEEIVSTDEVICARAHFVDIIVHDELLGEDHQYQIVSLTRNKHVAQFQFGHCLFTLFGRAVNLDAQTSTNPRELFYSSKKTNSNPKCTLCSIFICIYGIFTQLSFPSPNNRITKQIDRGDFCHHGKCKVFLYCPNQSVWTNHSHKKGKDSLETRAVFS